MVDLINKIQKIGFSGSCHWCTEAIFQSLKGVDQVDQGWIASTEEPARLYEGVIVHFHAEEIPLDILIAIHLYTHSCTSRHAMRDKYQSAIYTFDKSQQEIALNSLVDLAGEFDAPIITETLVFNSFKLNKASYLNYYQNNPEKPFCQSYIQPKLQLIFDRYSDYVRT